MQQFYYCKRRMPIFNRIFRIFNIVASFPKSSYQNVWKFCVLTLRQGPLNIWTEHSNVQIHSRVGLKKPYSFTDTQYFLDFYWWNYFNMYLKAEGMTKFDVFHVFVENSVNSEFCFFWDLLKPAKIWNLPKNACVWAA